MFLKLKLIVLCGRLYLLGLIASLSQVILCKAIRRSLHSKFTVFLSKLTERLLFAFTRLEKKVIKLFIALSFEQ